MKYLNGKLIETTSDEETLIEKQRADDKKIKANEAKIRETKATNKLSAITKLKTLGLSDDEISALVGE